MNELTAYTYEQWVAEGKPLVQRWKGATLDICRFLWPKREAFASRRPEKGKTNDVRDRTWTDFLHDIGLARSTAHDWLAKYDAGNDRMLPPPEAKPRPQKTPEQVEQKRQESRERAREEVKQRREEFQSFENAENTLLGNALTELVEHTEKRQAFKQRIRLSQSGESDAFIDALMDYLDELPDDSRRIEACQNVIKVCRNVAAQLQRESA